MIGVRAAPPPHIGTRYERIADDMARRIRRDEWPIGSPVPTTTELAEHYDVSRGTMRHALEVLSERHSMVTRLGRRWVVHTPTRQHSFSVLRSFGQWAVAMGYEPSGVTVSLERGRATQTEAIKLGVAPKGPVLRCVRLRFLDGDAVMLERTTYPDRLAHAIAALPPEIPSVMEVLERDHGVALAHADHRISTTSASGADAALLGVRRGTPLLRVRRTGRCADGQAFEYGDDRYLPDVVDVSVVSTV